MTNLNNMGRDFELTHLEETDLKESPFDQFHIWIQDAIAGHNKDPNGMALATSNAQGRVSVRMMLLKFFDENGFVFFTNYMSHKGASLHAHPQAAILFWWPEFERQVRVEGQVHKLDKAHSDHYFQQRSFESNLVAIHSKQSQNLKDKEAFINEIDQARQAHDPDALQRPDYWGGYILKPDHFEFWQGGSHRLHDRLTYTLNKNTWEIQRLYP